MKPPNTARLHELRMRLTQRGYDMAEVRERFQRLNNRHENGTAPRAVVAHQLFQTPANVAARLVGLLDLKPGARVLEPSAGLGRILDALQPCQPGEVVAVEVAAACAGELYRQERHGVKIVQRDFLTMEPQELGYFDAVAMNPPFTMRSDIRHIRHALEFLNPGGLLAAILMDTQHRRQAFESEALQWIELPPETFRLEGATVNTAMVLLRA